MTALACKLGLAAAICVAAIAGAGMVVAWDGEAGRDTAALMQPAAVPTPQPAVPAQREYPAPVAMPYVEPGQLTATPPAASQPSRISAQYPRHSGR